MNICPFPKFSLAYDEGDLTLSIKIYSNDLIEYISGEISDLYYNLFKERWPSQQRRIKTICLPEIKLSFPPFAKFPKHKWFQNAIHNE